MFRRAWHLLLVIALLAALAAVVSGCGSAQPEEDTSAPVKPMSPMSVEVSLTGVPSLNNPVQLELVAATSSDAPDAVIRLLLPEQFELVSGQLSWEGHIHVDDTIRLQATVRATEEGQYVIKGSGRAVASYRFGDNDFLYVTVSRYTGEVSETAPIPEMEEQETIAIDRDESE